MARYLEILLLLIALSHSGHAAASDDGERDTEAPPTTPTCEEGDEYINAANNYLQAIQGAFNNAIAGTKIDVKNALSAPSTAYLKAAKVCSSSDALLNTWNETVFVDFVSFALKNATELKELKEKNQYGCILKHQKELNECINATMVTDHKMTYSSITDLSKLQFNDITCPRSKLHRSCTLLVLQEKCSDSAKYVTKLFDYMKTYCDSLPKNGSGSMKMTAVLVGLFVCLVEFTKRTTL